MLAYMERGCGQRWCGIALGVAILLIAWGPGAYGLDPALDVSQYAHTAWTVRDGFSRGNIYAMAQTPDGFLWLGTEFGLFLFDGVRSIPWQPPAGQQLPEQNINALLVTRDGTLWIGTFAGLATWSGGKLTWRPELGRQFVASLFEDREGTVWASTLAGT
jgi:ligand-binding sensor domain-containing protein